MFVIIISVNNLRLFGGFWNSFFPFKWHRGLSFYDKIKIAPPTKDDLIEMKPYAFEYHTNHWSARGICEHFKK